MNNSLRVVPFDAGLQKLAFSFDCGNAYMNRFLRSMDALNDGIGKTYVCLGEPQNGIIGYYNISTGYLERSLSGCRVEKIGGSLHINYFALDTHYHKTAVSLGGETFYLSDWLLIDCLCRARHIRRHFVGFSFVTLCSTEEGHRLYLRNDFEDLSDEGDMAFTCTETEEHCYRMYLPLDYE